MQILRIQFSDFIGIDRQEITLLLAARLCEQGSLIGQAAQVKFI
jgi:hypothetical protein